MSFMCRIRGRRGTARSASKKFSKLIDQSSTPSELTDDETSVRDSMTENLFRLYESLKGEDMAPSMQRRKRRRSTGGLVSVVNPMSFYLSFLSNSTMGAFEQCDVSEFLNVILDTMHSELVSARNPEIPSNLITFDEQFPSELCDIFRGFSNTVPFLDLPLDIPLTQLETAYFLPPFGWKLSPLSIDQCLRHTLKNACIDKAPEVLILSLRRAGFAAGKSLKNTVHVHVDPDLCVPGASNKSLPYQLSAIVVHQGGGSQGGHYSCYSKRKDEWYYLNDAHVKRIGGVELVLEDLESKKKHFQPCLIFYQKNSQPGGLAKPTSFFPLQRGHTQ